MLEGRSCAPSVPRQRGISRNQRGQGGAGGEIEPEENQGDSG